MLHAEIIRPVPELLRDAAARHGTRTALSDGAVGRRSSRRIQELEERTTDSPATSVPWA